MPIKNVIKKNAMIPTALVAGGAGFVGSHLCEALLAKGARVIVLDNFKSRADYSGKQSFVNHLLSNPNFAMYDCDINNGIPEDVASVDYIFHLAGLEEYSYSKEVLDLTSLLTNAFGTKYLLDLAQSSQAKFLLLSTTDVYEGRMSQLELSEYFGRNKIEENRYMLAEAKRYAEALVWEFYKKHNVDARIVRVPEVYGPRMNLVSSGNLGRFMSDIISGRDLTVYGEGSEKEFYLHIDDAVSGVLKAMYNDKTKGDIFSLVPDEPTSVLELAYMVKGVADAGVQVRFEEGSFRPGILKTPDTYNLEILKWEPRVSLKDGIVSALTSFNYATNQNSFKPAKLIEQKLQEQIEQIPTNLFTLQGIKKETPPPTPRPYIVEAPKSGANFVPEARGAGLNLKLPSLSLPEFQIPKITLPAINLPHINLPKLPEFVSKKLALIFAFVFPALIIFVVLPFFTLFLNFKKAHNAINQAKNSAMQVDVEGVKANAKIAYESFYQAKKSLSSARPVFIFLRKQDEFKTYDKLLGAAANFSKATYSGAKGAMPMQNLWEVVRPDTQAQLDVKEFEEAKNQFGIAKNSLLLSQADFKYANPKKIPAKYQHYYTEFGQALDQALEGIDMLIPVYNSLPKILGATGEQKYLILFQNSNELRATGGFIGSYGILTFENGKIKNLIIDDIYNPDGQMDQRNMVSVPPKPIADLLKEERLHIRNANWDPDFTASANTISDLYFNVTGEKMDGVFAVDLYFIQNLLKVTGPIFLTVYNEEITEANVYERAEFHSEFNYKDGSDQKRSFLTVLGSKLLERLFSLEKEKLSPLAASLMQSLNERHLQFYFANDPLNEFLKARHWDGSLVSVDGDYLFVVDSNLGGTKANYYVNKTMDYQVNALTRDGVLRSTLKLEYHHNGQDLAWPGGPYTDYLRVLTKQGAKLTGATIKFGDAAEENIFEKIITGVQGKYQTFETSFVLNPQQKVIVTINYDLPPALTLTKLQTDYSLYWQKQAGTNNEQTYFAFFKPFGFTVLESSTNLVNLVDRFELKSQLKIDQNLYVKLQ